MKIILVYLMLIYQDNVQADYIGCFLNFAANPVYNKTPEECKKLTINTTYSFYAYLNNKCYHGNNISNSISSEYCMNCTKDSTSNQCKISKYSVYSVCPIGYFGSKCLERCHCKNGISCFRNNGTCMNSCKLQWILHNCSKFDTTIYLYEKLKDKYLGCYFDGGPNTNGREWNNSNVKKFMNISQCINYCSNLFLPYAVFQNNLSCSCLKFYGKFHNISNGTCRCEENKFVKCTGIYFNGVFSACPLGTYGDKCKHDCNCESDNYCNASGNCLENICKLGWNGSTCSNRDCRRSNGNCELNEYCVEDIYSNHARCECKNGYTKNKFWLNCTDLDECSTGFNNCDKNTTHCNNTEGTYICNCKNGFLQSDNYSCNDINECINTISCKENEQCTNTFGNFQCGCLHGYTKNDSGICTDIDECTSKHIKCNLTTTNCTNTMGSYTCLCKSGFQNPDNFTCSEIIHLQLINPNWTSYTVGVIMSVLIIGLIILGIYCLKKRKFLRPVITKKGRKVTHQPISEEELKERSIQHLTLVNKDSFTKVKLKDIDTVLIDRPRMAKEFMDVPKQTGESTKYGEQLKLKHKNRFRNVVPYDDNRVILISEKNLPLSEYVNASYIQDFNPSIKNIATQGPTLYSIEDFWQMAIEQNISIIVMLTNCFEKGNEKCSLYWPEESSTFGLYKIKLIKSVNWSHIIIRYFNISINNTHIKDIMQMHHIAWPDKELPKNIPSVLLLRSLLRSHLKINELFAVHCSAGIGRTGTFFCIDYLIEEGKKEGCIDAAASLQMLRRQRPLMIQTLDQYILCYKMVHINYLLQNTLMDFYQLKLKLQNYQNNENHNEIVTEFEVIENEFKFFKEDKSNLKKTYTGGNAISILPGFCNQEAFILSLMSDNLSDRKLVFIEKTKFVIIIGETNEAMEAMIPKMNEQLNISEVTLILKEINALEFATIFIINRMINNSYNNQKIDESLYANSVIQSSLTCISLKDPTSWTFDNYLQFYKLIKPQMGDIKSDLIPLLAKTKTDAYKAVKTCLMCCVLECAIMHSQVDLFTILYQFKLYFKDIIENADEYADLYKFLYEYLSMEMNKNPMENTMTTNAMLIYENSELQKDKQC